MKSGIIIKDDKDGKPYEIEGDFYEPGQIVVGGWAEVFCKNRKITTKRRLRLERFKKPFGVWNDDAAGMICKCAEADALRSTFPTMLGGLYMREELDSQGAVANGNGTANVSRPLFNGSASGQIEAGDPSAAPVEPTAPDEPLASAVLAKLRAMLAQRNIAENALLNYLIEVGTVSDSVASLDDVQSSSPETIKALVVNFDQVVANVKEGN